MDERPQLEQSLLDEEPRPEMTQEEARVPAPLQRPTFGVVVGFEPAAPGMPYIADEEMTEPAEMFSNRNAEWRENWSVPSSLFPIEEPVTPAQAIKDDFSEKMPLPLPMSTPLQDTISYPIQLTPPGPQQLFRLESEPSFRSRLRREAVQRDPKEQLTFPESKTVGSYESAPRRAAGYTRIVEPHYVTSRRLLYEQPWSERFGRHAGVIEPGVAGSVFLFDAMTWPVRWLAHPFQCWQYNADRYSPYFQGTQ